MLSPQGVSGLQEVLVRLKRTGTAIVFITHKRPEALSIGDRLTILRAGRVVGRLGTAELRSQPRDKVQELIVDAMFGAEAPAVSTVAELRDRVAGQDHHPAVVHLGVRGEAGRTVRSAAPGASPSCR